MSASLGGPRFRDLGPGAQLVLWASRHWMAAFRDGKRLRPCVWRSFAAAELPEAFEELSRLLILYLSVPGAAEGFAQPDDPGMSGAERHFLRVLGALERDRMDDAIGMLQPDVGSQQSRAIAGQAVSVVWWLKARRLSIGTPVADSRGRRRFVPVFALRAATRH